MASKPQYFSFCGDVTEQRAREFKPTFTRAIEESEQLWGRRVDAVILFHSRGGEAKPAHDLYGFLNERSDRLTVINIGYVGSAALTMFLAVPRERRWMAEHAVFMCHDVTQKIDGIPTEEEMVGFEESRREDSRFLRDVILRETTIAPDEWDCACQLQLDIWHDRDDAMERGLVSKVGGFRLPRAISIINL